MNLLFFLFLQVVRRQFKIVSIMHELLHAIYIVSAKYTMLLKNQSTIFKILFCFCFVFVFVFLSFFNIVCSETVEQARNLVEKMKFDSSIDYDNDWKVVTVFIGGNDICDWCHNNTFYHPDEYVEYVKQALTILHDEVSFFAILV